MMIATIFFVVIATLIAVGVSGPAASAYKSANDSILSEQSYAAASSGVEDAYYRLTNALPLGSTNTLKIGGVTASTTVAVNNSTATTTIIGTGQAYGFGRVVQAVATQGTIAAFPYGVDAGHGGIALSGNSLITGSAYDIGLLSATSGATITGSAISATAAGPTVDQTNGTGTPPASISFANANATLDVAQSFTVAGTSPVSEAAFYIEKTGSPSNATVEIVTDNNGVPGSLVLATGSLTSATLTAAYKWITVTIAPNPVLDPGEKYWVVIHPSTASSANYYTLAASTGGYAAGIPLVGSTLTNTWRSTTPSTLSSFFKIYTGGFIGTISGYSSSPLLIGTVSSDVARGRSVSNTVDNGGLYCSTGNNNSKACTTATDPAPRLASIVDSNLLAWKSAAMTAGDTEGNYTVTTAHTIITSRKIHGNLTISAAGATTIDGTLWVTGNVTISNCAQVSLSADYGSKSGVIIVDGTVSVSGNSVLSGSGTPGSYMIIASDSSSASAVTIAGGSHTLVVVAPYGTVTLSSSAWIRQVTAYAVHLTGNSNVAEDPTLQNGIQIQGGAGTNAPYSLESWGETFK